jgi:hypothetical protein
MVAVTQILLKPEAAQGFEIVLQQIRKALPETGTGRAISNQWYELVAGGDRPQRLPGWETERVKFSPRREDQHDRRSL